MASTTDAKLDLLGSLYFPPPTASIPSDIPPDSSGFVPITMQELQAALNSTLPLSAPGYDGIPAVALQNLSDGNKTVLLSIYNASLLLGHVPPQWKMGRTVVLRKPGKTDYTQARSYRPITMLACISKLLEKVVARRLRFWVSWSQAHWPAPIVSSSQFGFLPQRSCEQAMAVLVDSIRHGWSRNSITTVVFLDVSMAYDTVVHAKLLHRMRQQNLPPYLITWFANFLHGRKTALWVNGHSKEFAISVGLPQGSPASPILYTIYNDLALSILNDRTLSAGFADDLACWVSGASIEDNCRVLQLALDRLHSEWCVPFNQHLDPAKCTVMHFSPTRHPNAPVLDQSTTVTVNGHLVPVRSEVRYLGAILDNKLSFDAHCRQLTSRGMRLLGALRYMGNRVWGPHRQQRLSAIKMALLPTISYAAMIWLHYVPRSSIKGLELIYRQALVWASGALHTTPTALLLSETGMLPLDAQLALQTQKIWIKWLSFDDRHPISAITTAPTSSALPAKAKRILAYFFPRRPARLGGIDRCNNEIIPLTGKLPWGPNLLECGIVNLAFPGDRDRSVSEWHRQSYLHRDRVQLYTDGSKTDTHTGASCVRRDFGQSSPHILARYKFAASVDVFQAEALALIAALSWCIHWNARAIIFSDSLSTLLAVLSPHTAHGEAFAIYQMLLYTGDRVLLQWVPGHSGIPGNDDADHVARVDAADSRLPLFTPPLTCRFRVRQLLLNIHATWTTIWRRHIADRGTRHILQRNHPPSKSDLAKFYPSRFSANLTSTTIQLRCNHIRIGNYCARLRGFVPRCACGWDESLEHIFLHCPNYHAVRARLLSRLASTKQSRRISLTLKLLLDDPACISDTLWFWSQILPIRRRLCPWLPPI
jgi:ribonuclease HI